MPNADASFESYLQSVIDRAAESRCPPLLASALQYAVFPGGARVRPTLCLAVAAANGNSDPVMAAAAAGAIELLHCASLVHDDLPCFDNARERRGKPSVHVSYGERIAVLAGDTLIVTAFESLALAAAKSTSPGRLSAVMGIVGRGVGAPLGICAGQAWECEPEVDVSLYHRAKTGALFVAATCAGAAAAGADPAGWALLGERIGEGYQVADDIHDATATEASLGKPVGRDEALGRPSAVRELGLEGAVQRLKQLVEEGAASIPECPGRARMQELVRDQAKRFLPKSLGRRAA